MEFTLKILPIVISILIPLLAWFGSFRDLRKDRRENLLKNYELAKDFDLALNSTASQFTKDRLAKALVSNHDVNYTEVLFFRKYFDADEWLSRFADVKNNLTIQQDHLNEIIGFDEKISKKQHYLNWVKYVVVVSLFATPFCFFNTYSNFLKSLIDMGNYLLPIELVLLPFMSLIASLIFANKLHNFKEAKKFIEDFNLNAKLI